MSEQIQLLSESKKVSEAIDFDLSCLLKQPVFDTKALLYIEALAPLSIVTSMSGKYYRCQPEPTKEMLCGMFENALGWHFGEQERTELLKKMRQRLRIQEAAYATRVGFKSLLQFHVRFETQVVPPLLAYDDYWSQHLRETGKSFVGGSRTYDYRAIPIMNAIRREQVTVNDRANADRNPYKLHNFHPDDLVHLNVLRPYFPQYYSSPKLRGYVIPLGTYQYKVETSTELANTLSSALLSPAAPLYIGSNDGWVDVHWESFA